MCSQPKDLNSCDLGLIICLYTTKRGKWRQIEQYSHLIFLAWKFPKSNSTHLTGSLVLRLDHKGLWGPSQEHKWEEQAEGQNGNFVFHLQRPEILQPQPNDCTLGMQGQCGYPWLFFFFFSKKSWKPRFFPLKIFLIFRYWPHMFRGCVCPADCQSLI